MDTKTIPAMEVISKTNFENFLGGYLTANQIRDNCIFLVPEKFATSPEKQLVNATDHATIAPKDN